MDELSLGTGHRPDAVYALTAGNPFFVSEVLCAADDELPASARDAVLARAARLSEPGRAVLDAAALVGERVESALLAEVTGADACSLDEPVGAGLLEADGGALRFRHEIARRAVEHEVGPHTAAELHRRILTELESAGVDDDSRLAHHAEGSLDGAATLRYATRAGDRSASLASRREAVTQYRRALRSVPAEQPLVRAALLDKLGTQLSTLDQFGPAAEALEESVPLWRAGSVPLREGDALRRLSVAYYRLCRGAEEHAVIQRALDVLEPLGASRELAWALSRTAAQYMDGSETEKCYAYAHRAQAMARALNLPDVASDALNTLACVEYPGERWFDWVREALDLAVEHKFPDQTGRGYANLQAMLVDEMRYAEAEHFYREGMAYCDEHDNHTSGLCLAGGQAQVLMVTGRWAAVEEIAQGPLSGDRSSPINRVTFLVPLGLQRARRGVPGCGSAWTRPPPPPWRPASRRTPPSAGPRASRPAGWPASRTRSWPSWSWPPGTPGVRVRAAQRRPGPLPDDRRGRARGRGPPGPVRRGARGRRTRGRAALGRGRTAGTTPRWRCSARATRQTCGRRWPASTRWVPTQRPRSPAATCARPASAAYPSGLVPRPGSTPPD